jgi:hypothetical protein
MTRRRGAGEGTITRRADGRWVGAVQIGTDENGKRLRRWVYGLTRGEAVEQRLLSPQGSIPRSCKSGSGTPASR